MPRITQPLRFRARRHPELLLIMLLLMALPGCVVGDFIGVYFNTYYNVQRLFSDAQDEVWALPETKSSGMNLLVQFVLPAPTKTKFTSVIEKCSKLLQYHPESRYVDDALLIIAKSYYFQAEYQKAERKCLELINGFPESDLFLETKLLLACARYKMNNQREAQDLAKEVVDLAAKDGEDWIGARASLVLAAVEQDNKNYDEARKHFQRAGELGENVDLRSSALLNAAEMLFLMGDYKGAEEAYRRAYEASANYTGEYRASIGAARMAARQGRYDDALKALVGLRGNTNYREFFGEIELEIANDLRDQGEIDQAVSRYRMIDTTYARTETSANSYLQLGLLYETRLSFYDSARVVYNKGRTEFPQAAATQQLVRRGDYLTRYSQFVGEIVKFDSLRTALLAARDSSARRRDSTAAGQGKVQDSVSRGNFPGIAGPMSLDSIEVRLASAKNELAVLFYATIGRADSALYWFRRLMRDHPQSSFIARALFTEAQILSQDSTTVPGTVDSLYREVVRRYPDSPFANEARRVLGIPPLQKETDPAEGMYSRAELLIDSGKATGAIDTLRNLVHLYPTSLFAPKAQYSIGWLYENVTVQPESAYANYTRLVQLYPTSHFSQKIQPKIVDPEVRARFTPEPPKSDTVVVAPTVKLPIDTTTSTIDGRPDGKLEGKKGKQPEEARGAQDRVADEPKEKKPK